MTSVFDSGYVSYNDVVFNLTTQVKCQVACVYNRSVRKVNYLKYSLTIEAVLTSDDCLEDPSPGDVCAGSTDCDLVILREKLMVSGKTLVIKNIGLGYDLEVRGANVILTGQNLQRAQNMLSGGNRYLTPAAARRIDVLFGPKPQVLDWEPIGFNKACRIRWTVEFHLPTCGNDTTDIADFEWNTNWSINNVGLTVRNVTGQIEVAGQITNGKAADNAERYRWMIDRKFPPLEGYHRSTQRNLSADRRILAFSVQDVEIDTGDNAYYPGVVDADISFNTRNLQDYVFTTWVSELSGSISVRPRLDKKVAWLAFLVIFREKVRAMANFRRAQRGLGKAFEDEEIAAGLGGVEGKDGSWVLMNLNISEQMFGRVLSFSIRWFYSTDLVDLLPSTAHFLPLDTLAKMPLPGAKEPHKIHDWKIWKQSMADAQTSTGFNGQSWSTEEEVLIGFCDASTGQSLSYGDAKEDKSDSDPLLQKKLPDVDKGWIDYQQKMEVYENSQTARQVIIKESTPGTPYGPTQYRQKGKFKTSDVKDGLIQVASKGDTVGSATTGGASTGIPEAPIMGELADERADKNEGRPDNNIMYRRSDSTFIIRLLGSAMRAGRPAPTPHLFDIGGNPATLIQRKVTSFPVGRGSTEIWKSNWDLTFSMSQAPRGELSEVGKGREMVGHTLAEGIQ